MFKNQQLSQFLICLDNFYQGLEAKPWFNNLNSKQIQAVAEGLREIAVAILSGIILALILDEKLVLRHIFLGVVTSLFLWYASLELTREA